MSWRFWALFFLLNLEAQAQIPWKNLWKSGAEPLLLGIEGGQWKAMEGKNALSLGNTIRESSGKLLVLRHRKSLDTLLLRPEVLGLESGWTQNSHLEAAFEGPQAGLTLYLGFQGQRGCSEEKFELKPGFQRCRLSLEALPFVSVPKSWHRPAYIRLRSEGKAKSYTISDLKLIREPDFDPVRVDSFGQRKKGDWRGKARKIMPIQPSPNEISSPALPVPYSRFGGSLNGNKEEATGKFSVIKTGNGWKLVDPLGYPFWSLGVTGVRISVPGFMTPYTPVAGREQIFEKLPPDSLRVGPNGEWAQFYHWNVLRKYGNLEIWKTQTHHRLRTWGFNTLGNWSDPMWMKNPVMPYTYTLRTNHNPSFNLRSGLPDVFNPDWASWVDSSFSEISKMRQDSFLLGYFVDNEFHWQDLDQVREETESFSHQVWKKHSHQPFGADSFRLAYAQRYFSVVKTALRRYDTAHLYLGCRFLSRVRFPEIIQTAARYCDVVSVNIYSADPEVARTWNQMTGKPILIGEFHIQLLSERQVSPLFPTFEEPKRSQMVKSYLEKCRSMPFLVGAHWYQFVDQPITGREGNGENRTIGLVDVCDQPYPELMGVFSEFANPKKTAEMPWLEKTMLKP